MTTLMDIVVGCENYLGFMPKGRADDSLNRLRCLEVYKLKRAMAAHARASVETLALALEYSRRRRLSLTSPIALLYRIDDALKLANSPSGVTELEAAITAAIGWERDRDDENSLNWIYRLKRAAGPGRDEVLTEWKAAQRG